MPINNLKPADRAEIASLYNLYNKANITPKEIDDLTIADIRYVVVAACIQANDRQQYFLALMKFFDRFNEGKLGPQLTFETNHFEPDKIQRIMLREGSLKKWW